jgi:DNA-binding transcriptional MocR family regulator
MGDYRIIAQGLADDIAAGRLEPGDRLPPQRIFAHDRGIAASTAGRVYAELTRRGLVTGETGRGTFVRTTPPVLRPLLAEPPTATINLETNYPVLPDQQAHLAPVLRRMARNPDLLQRALRETTARGTSAQRNMAARGLMRCGWQPDPESLLFAGNGRQALAAVFATIASPGDRIGFEAMTYPVARAIAERAGLVPVSLAMDAEGVVPGAIEAAHRAAPLRAIYLQPTMHNPIGTTASIGRRTTLAEMLEALDGPLVVEDAVYAFLDEHAPPPLRSFAPDRTILVDSLSKRIGPGLTLGIVAAPEPRIADVAEAIIAGTWGASGFAMEACLRWLADGTVAVLDRLKREDAAVRQQIAAHAFRGCDLRAHPASYHVMIGLPPNRRADDVVKAAASAGIAIAPASAFTVAAGHAPNAVRVGLANLDLASAREVLELVAGIVRGGDAIARNDACNSP